MTPATSIETVQRLLGYRFHQPCLLEEALTHKSYSNERRGKDRKQNERLEFLGDAVLDIIVTDLIFRARPDLPEGTLARLRASVVNTQALATLASNAGLGDHIRLGKGEEASGGRAKASLLADTFEAVVGAAYIDRGLPALAGVLVPVFSDLVARVEAEGRGYDPKTALQEVSVRDHGARPTYRVASYGPDHDKRFIAHAYVSEELYGSGSGHSKKEAEQAAAREALDRLTEEAPESSLPTSREMRSDVRAS